jgi:hypothetical protein
MWLFVVCGAEEHLETLNFSLRALKKRTRLPIRVVTDLARNAGRIEHDDVVDVRVDPRYDHHQASILLKTGLYRYVDLSEGKKYAYLDTDVVAVRPDVDGLFDHYTAPISFCTDHCRMRQFSPTAVHGEEHERALALQKKIHSLMAEAEERSGNPDKIRRIRYLLLDWEKSKKLRATGPMWQRYAAWGKPSWLRPLAKGWYRLSGHGIYHEANGDWYASKTPPFEPFFATHGFRYDRTEEKWYELSGEMVWDTGLARRSVEASTEVRWDVHRQQWIAPDGSNALGVIESDTLRRRIAEKFGIEVTEPDWQHWNGGVFVFDHRSEPFLETWHDWTKAIFDDPAWKTRDQGTLIAAVWKHRLQHHPTLPLEFNFLADYHHPTMRHLGQLQFALGPGKASVSPRLLHIYHHWGDKDWTVWQHTLEAIFS